MAKKSKQANGPRVQILTADKAGFGRFLHDLKRVVLGSEAAVAADEKRQAAHVAAIRRRAREKHAEGFDIHAYDARIAAVKLSIQADTQAMAYKTIRFYLGDLNRDVNDARVAEYETAMNEGKWWFTPDPIVVSTEGAIINGQHRLLAVEHALMLWQEKKNPEFVPPQFVVVWNVDKKAALLMDEARRTANDRRNIALRFAAAQEHAR